MQLLAVGVDGTADGLAVQTYLFRLIGAGGSPCGVAGPLGGGPLGDHCVQDVAVGVGADPPECGARRAPGGADTGAGVQAVQNVGGYVGDPAVHCGVALQAGYRGRRGKRENDRDRMISALVRPAVRNSEEQLQQIVTRRRERGLVRVRRQRRIGGGDDRLRHDEAPFEPDPWKDLVSTELRPFPTRRYRHHHLPQLLILKRPCPQALTLRSRRHSSGELARKRVPLGCPSRMQASFSCDRSGEVTIRLTFGAESLDLTFDGQEAVDKLGNDRPGRRLDSGRAVRREGLLTSARRR